LIDTYVKDEMKPLTRQILEKPLRYWIALIGFCFMLLAGCRIDGKKEVVRQIPRSERVSLLVLNFENTTLKQAAAQYDPWEFGIASMVMTDLETIGLFNIISLERLREVLKQQAFQMTGLADTEKAVKVGKIISAKYILAGSFMELNGSLRVESQLFSIEKGIQMGAASVTGSTKTFFDLEKQLVLRLLPNLGAILDEEETREFIGNIETKSVDASLNNYAGEIALLKADSMKMEGKEGSHQLIEEAKNRFKKALDYDPAYERAKLNLDKIVMGIPITL
jgi:TolB-like protein